MASKKKPAASAAGKKKARTIGGSDGRPATAEAGRKGSNPAQQEPMEEPRPVESSLSFPVVGVGASAGGVEAFTDLLSHLTRDAGLSLALVQHLSPKHVSILSEVLGRISPLPVTEVQDGEPVEINHVYVIPPNTDMAIQHGVLRLMPRLDVAGQQRLPIDYFFHSLAEDLGGHAIGVILSGTASDGALGLKAIKAEGGITFAQDEKTAKYDGMPRSAVAAGYVDFVLKPEDIAAELVRIGHHPYPHQARLDQTMPSLAVEDPTFSKILLLLRSTTGVDFTFYKPGTIKRRVLRRMLLQKIDDQSAYLKFLQSEGTEVWNLYNDILISVTGFFRDRESFEALNTLLFPRLFNGRSTNDPVRIWVPGCSTGEEAYSIAICLMEYLGEKGLHSTVQIFATDISDLALEKARAGLYPEGIAADVSPERLHRFFIKTETGYQVRKSIRDLCIFAKHNVYKDPPFSRLDLISCRNLLIYLGSVLHKKVFPIFFYALKPSGMLFLGLSETIGSFSHLFSLVDKKHKFYAKKSAAFQQSIDFGTGEALREQVKEEEKMQPREWKDFDVQREAERVLLAKYAPDGVIVNDRFEVVYFRGRTGAYLELAPGDATLNVLKMAREDLLYDLRNALLKAKKGGGHVRREGIAVRGNGKTRQVNLDIIPLSDKEKRERHYLVLFEAAVPPPAEEKAKGRAGKAKTKNQAAVEGRQVKQLRQEFAATKEYLHSIIEEQEATNEELRSANEEIQSSNEELQSTNEEMETAKEELQSTNEELNTVNEALESRNEELSQLNDDLLNLLTSVQVPVIMLGGDLRVRRLTVAAEHVLGITQADISRKITDFRSAVEVPGLEGLVHHVIETLESVEQEVRDVRGRWYTMRVRPYKTAENKIEGVVLAFYDVEEQKRANEQLRRHTDLLISTLSLMPFPILVLDGDRCVVRGNASFSRMFHMDLSQIQGRMLQADDGAPFDVRSLYKLMDHASRDSEALVEQALPVRSTDGKERQVKVRVHTVGADDGKPEYFIVTFEERP